QYALMRLTHFDKALEAWRATPTEPKSEQEAVLLAQMLSQREEAIAALTQIADLAECYPQSERLQLLLIATALRRGERDDVPTPLRERIRSALASFPERFPNSKAWSAVEF